MCMSSAQFKNIKIFLENIARLLDTQKSQKINAKCSNTKNPIQRLKVVLV